MVGDVAAAVAVLRSFESLSWLGVAGNNAVRQRFIDGLREHVFSLEALRDVLDDLGVRRAGHGGGDGLSAVEAGLGGGVTVVQAGRILDNFERVLGADFGKALQAEVPSRLSGTPDEQPPVVTGSGSCSSRCGRICRPFRGSTARWPARR